MKKEKIVYMGTPKFSAMVLEELIKYYDIMLVVTSKDKLVGRKKVLTASPVKQVAIKNGIEVLEISTLKNNYDYILSKNPDIIITCAFGFILPKELIFYPKYNTINVHTSLLPDLRGASPVRSALLKGYSLTGVTIMETNEKIDDGDILLKEEVPIDINDNIITLTDKMADIGGKLLVKALDSIFDGSCIRVTQDSSLATYVGKFTREDEKLSFDDTSINIYNKIRAFYDIGVYNTLDNENIKIFECRIGQVTKKNPGTITNIYKDGIGVACLDNEIIITKLQPPCKKIMFAKDYLNGINKNSLIGKSFEN